MHQLPEEAGTEEAEDLPGTLAMSAGRSATMVMTKIQLP